MTSVELKCIDSSREPTFDRLQGVGVPVVWDEQEFLKMTKAALESKWLTNNGPLIRRLEDQIKVFLGVKHAVCMANATIGLELVVRATLALDRGTVDDNRRKEVIVPSWTFVATVHAIHNAGATPVFCDVDEQTHNVTEVAVRAAITERTAAILAVNLWGQACQDIDKLEALALSLNVPLLFDSAHSFACAYGGRKLGSFGTAEVFSMHATKFFNSLEGGVVTTNDDSLANRLRLMRNFGFEATDKVVMAGTNGKMCEVAAAMGLANLKHIEEAQVANYRVYQQYRQLLSTIPGFDLACVPNYNDDDKNYNDNNQNNFAYGTNHNGRNLLDYNFQYVVVHVDSHRFGLSRDELQYVLEQENIGSRRYFFPSSHRMEPYVTASIVAGHRPSLPVTERLSEIVLVLPSGKSMLDGDKVEKVCAVIARAHAAAKRIRLALRDNQIQLRATTVPYDDVVWDAIVAKAVVKKGGSNNVLNEGNGRVNSSSAMDSNRRGAAAVSLANVAALAFACASSFVLGALFFRTMLKKE